MSFQSLGRNRVLTWLSGLLLTLGLVVSTVQYIRAPFFLGWDAVPYLGVIEQRPDRSIQEVHDKVYSTIRNEVSLDAYMNLIADASWLKLTHRQPETHWGDVHYRQVTAADPVAYTQQFPFYAPRVGFLLFVRLLHALDSNWFQAFRLSALVPSLILLWVAGAFAIFKIPAPLNLGVAIVWWEYSPLKSIVGMSNPDAVFTLLAGAGCCLLLSRRWCLLGFVSICVGTAMRPDGVLLAAPAMLAVYYLHPDLERTRKLKLAATMAGLILYVLAVQRLGHTYPLQTLWYHSLVRRMPYPAAGHVGITFPFYLQCLNLSTADLYYWAPWVWVCAAALLILGLSSPQYRPSAAPVAIVVASCVGHLLIFPHFEPRYFAIVPVCVLVGIADAARTAYRRFGGAPGILTETPTP